MQLISLFASISFHICSTMTSASKRSLCTFPEAVAVTIVSGGVKDKEWMLKELTKQGMHPDDWVVLDLRPLLKRDPATSVGHERDYTDEWTFMTVAGQEGFVKTVLEIVEKVAAGSLLVFIHCQSGWHRASCTSAVVQDQLNSVVHDFTVDGKEPSRIFNARWFPLHRMSSTNMWHQQFNNMKSWTESGGWSLCRGPESAKEILGIEAAQMSMESKNNMAELNFEVEKRFKRVCSCDAAGDSDVEDAGKTVRQHVEDIEKPKTPELVPPPPPPCKVSKVLPKAPPVGVQGPARPRQPPTPPSADLVATYKAAPSTAAPLTAAPVTPPETPPDWVSFSQDPNVWHTYLDEHNVDMAAQKSLFLLAQYDDHGRKLANTIIANFVRMENDRKEMRNASGWIYTAVLNARKELR